MKSWGRGRDFLICFSQIRLPAWASSHLWGPGQKGNFGVWVSGEALLPSLLQWAVSPQGRLRLSPGALLPQAPFSVRSLSQDSESPPELSEFRVCSLPHLPYHCRSVISYREAPHSLRPPVEPGGVYTWNGLSWSRPGPISPSHAWVWAILDTDRRFSL